MTRQTTKPLERLAIDNGNMLLTQLVTMVEKGRLLLDPPYQRGDTWTDDQRIALIYSWMTGANVPSVTINDRSHTGWRGGGRDSRGAGWYVVIDGRQRLTTAVMWMRGEFAVPASWFPAGCVADTEDTDDGAYVRYTGLTYGGKAYGTDRASLLVGTTQLNTVEEEAAHYLLVNGGGTPQTAADMARAAAVAAGDYTDPPRFPAGTAEHTRYARELRTELRAFAAGRDPYPYPTQQPKVGRGRPNRLYVVASVNGYIQGPAIRTALGLPAHVQQADIYLVARSKREAIDLAAATPGLSKPPSASVSLAVGPYHEPLQVLTATPGAYVAASPGRGPYPRLVRVAPDGSCTVVAERDRDGRWVFETGGGAS